MAAINFGPLMPTFGGRKPKDFYLDGDYSTAQPTGAPIPRYPFLEQGDTESVIFHQPHDQALASYSAPDLTKLMPGVSNAYPLGDVNFRDGKTGILEFERVFGNIPKRRQRRGQSFSYAFQYVLNSGTKVTSDGEGGDISFEGPTYTLGTRPATVDSVLTYDYFLDGDEDQFPLLLQPLVIQIGQKIQTCGDDLYGGNFPLYLSGTCVCAPDGTYILAENDGYADWMGAIKCRVRRTIKAPTPLFWLRNGAGG